MFGELLKRLVGEEAAPREIDYQHAIAALLVRCARVDDDFDAAEVAVIDQILQDRYGMSAAEAAALRAEGEELEETAGDTQHLTSAIKDGVPYEERIAVVEALWRVVLADETRDHHENAFLRLVVRLLGVTDVDSGKARQRVSDG